MVVTAWHMLTTGEHYRDLGPDHFVAHQRPDRVAERKLADLKSIGWEMVTNPDGSVTLRPPLQAA